MTNQSKKPVVLNALSARDRVRNYPVMDKNGKTVPDQTLSIRQILIRHARGIPMPPGSGYFDESGETQNLKSMELTDLMDYREGVKEELVKMSEKAKKASKTKEKNELRKEIEAELLAETQKKEAEKAADQALISP